MAATTRTLPATASAPLHPLLDRRLEAESGAVYATDLSPARHWVLAEHRILGTPAVPGTAWLEMAHAAFVLETGATAVELRDVVFVSPLLIAEGDHREVRVVLEPDGGAMAFRMISRIGDDWQEHARGSLCRLSSSSLATRDLAALAARCTLRELVQDGGAADGENENLVFWGPRWQSFRRADLGDAEALVALELPGELTSEVEVFSMHPALLDVATSFGGGVLAGGKALPHSYRRIAVYGPIPARPFVQIRSGGEPEAGMIVMDITLMDEHGEVRIEIEGFTMKRIAEREPTSTPAGRGRDWIRPEEGVEAFRRAISRGRLSQITISPASLAAIAAQVIGGSSAASTVFERPSLAIAYAPPSTEAEEALAEIWQRVLGLDRVGVYDNFFDLGGDSVVAIQMVAQATARGLSLTPEQLFAHQTIAALAQLTVSAEPVATNRPGSPEPGVSDFPESDLSQESLDRLFARLKDMT